MPNYSFHTYAPDVLVYDSSTGTFTLSSGYDFRTDRNLVQYRDDDATMNGAAGSGSSGSDANQIGSAYDDQGNLIEAGEVYARAYADLRAPDGSTITIDRIEIDGVHVGYVPSQPLVPGTVYDVTFSEGINNGNAMQHSYYDAKSVPCFDAATLIQTVDGQVSAADLRVGQAVLTLDHGPQPIRWRCERRVDLRDAAAADMPVLIPAKALGAGRPARELIVSGQHRLLLGHPGQGPQLAPSQLLVSAKALVGLLPGARTMRGRKSARWVHFACRNHQIVTANGAYAESLLLGQVCLNGLLPPQRDCLERLIRKGEIHAAATPARPCLGVRETQRLAARLLRLPARGFQPKPPPDAGPHFSPL